MIERIDFLKGEKITYKHQVITPDNILKVKKETLEYLEKIRVIKIVYKKPVDNKPTEKKTIENKSSNKKK